MHISLVAVGLMVMPLLCLWIRTMSVVDALIMKLFNTSGFHNYGCMDTRYTSGFEFRVHQVCNLFFKGNNHGRKQTHPMYIFQHNVYVSFSYCWGWRKMFRSAHFAWFLSPPPHRVCVCVWVWWVWVCARALSECADYGLCQRTGKVDANFFFTRKSSFTSYNLIYVKIKTDDIK